MRSVVAIVGEGVLADLVCERLQHVCDIVRPSVNDLIPREISCALVLQDVWDPSFQQRAAKALQEVDVPWLRAFATFGEGIVGPFVFPDVPGCFQCADMRRLMAGRDRKEMWGIRKSEKVYDPGASRTALLQLAHLVEEEARRFLQEQPLRCTSHMYVLQLKSMQISRRFILADPLCSFCGALPEDTAEHAAITLRPSLKVEGSYRSRSIHELGPMLLREYLDTKTGLLNEKIYDLVPPFADASVNLPLIMGDEGTAGRTHSYENSVVTAILEGLERYCGLAPRGKRTMLRDCFENIKADALHPLVVGVHAEEDYARANFPFQPFDPSRKINWVWGYSLLENRPILIPERFAYYSLGCNSGHVYETSNGCAIGGSLEEAILYGIFEVVERDAFLMTWYATLALPRLDPYSVGDEELHMMLARIKATAGYEIFLFDATMENRIPSIMAIAKNQKETGLNLICAAGAHLDPVRAVKSALHELAGMMLTLDEKFEAEKDTYMRMLEDSSLVTRMDHHSMLYGLPEAEGRLQFLLEEKRETRTFAQAFGEQTYHTDLTEDLRCVLDTFKRLQLDVIVVDQTAPELQRNGLYCVKVIIPGMLPMTFGNHLKRITGLERVLRVPVQLGYVKEPLTFTQLNQDPHPFP
ncbi:TOMM precursor leader peptide-binding protein [Ectobacillus antri]|uniref:TOMM precursor leader peptide-binding protein n=1 Tax=Ectobacillus antri TaxID=2486280 RepID=UPI000F5A362A|nr:TOMM precursor leader peptide-binding protein [Ectobacillus antri]